MATTTIQGKEIGLVYTGRAGCMCGCRGKYSNKPAVIARVAKRMRQLPPSQLVEDEGCCFSVTYETPGGSLRTLVAYYDRNKAA